MTAPPAVRTSTEHIVALSRNPWWVQDQPTVIQVEGPGAIDCLQGVLTCDVAAPGPGAVLYGATLTPKGMIVADFTVLRQGPNAVTLVAAPQIRATVLDLFRRLVPPRLARVTDRTELSSTVWLLGTAAGDMVGRVGLPWPEEPARLAAGGRTGDMLVARPAPHAPWTALLLGPLPAIQSARDALRETGAAEGTAQDREILRILSGWPALGREIDQKTLPQEVRFDELGGVSYTKGCYVGQETVARVHFRGHPNRFLLGLLWREELGVSDVRLGDKLVGRVTSALQAGEWGAGLGVLRREVEPGMTVRIGEVAAKVLTLPFPPGNSEAPGIVPGASPRQ